MRQVLISLMVVMVGFCGTSLYGMENLEECAKNALADVKEIQTFNRAFKVIKVFYDSTNTFEDEQAAISLWMKLFAKMDLAKKWLENEDFFKFSKKITGILLNVFASVDFKKGINKILKGPFQLIDSSNIFYIFTAMQHLSKLNPLEKPATVVDFFIDNQNFNSIRIWGGNQIFEVKAGEETAYLMNQANVLHLLAMMIFTHPKDFSAGGEGVISAFIEKFDPDFIRLEEKAEVANKFFDSKNKDLRSFLWEDNEFDFVSKFNTINDNSERPMSPFELIETELILLKEAKDMENVVKLLETLRDALKAKYEPALKKFHQEFKTLLRPLDNLGYPLYSSNAQNDVTRFLSKVKSKFWNEWMASQTGEDFLKSLDKEQSKFLCDALKNVKNYFTSDIDSAFVKLAEKVEQIRSAKDPFEGLAHALQNIATF